MPAQLKISDGTNEASLIDIGPGIHLNDWTPAIAQYKGGGVFRSNPQSSGRRLIQKQFDNVIETFDLKVNNLKRNILIFQMQELLRLLEKATDYWASDWQDTVVYLVAQAECEDNARYAEIVSYSIPQLDNPYDQPFLSTDGNAVFDGITLVIERKHWKANIPGNGTAVSISSTQDYDGRTLGQEATTGFEAFVTTHHNVANISDVYVDDGGVFGSNLMDAALPYSLLPASPAVNDAVYFGIDTSLTDSGPFASLVFDIGTALTVAAPGNIVLVWEYWDGATWSAFTTLPIDLGGTYYSSLADATDTDPDALGAGTSANPYRGQQPFSITGVNIVQWRIPADWATTTVNSITGYWVRARVSSFTSVSTIPTQQNRDIYSVILPYVNIDSAQVLGDIPALARIVTTNTVGTDKSPDYIDRVIVGLRSTARGSDFTAYLNIADEQEPGDVYSVSGTGVSDFNAVASPSGTGRVKRHIALNNPDFTTVATITLTNPTHWIGTYHAFLRISVDAGTIGDIIYGVSSNVNGDIISSRQKTITTYLTGGEDDWELVDIGLLSLTPQSILTSDTLISTAGFNIWISSTSSPNTYLSDLILIPMDEFAADMYQEEADIEDGQSLYALDLDPITNPSEINRAVYRTGNGATTNGATAAISTYPAVVNNNIPILQANATQKLWFLFAQHPVLTGTHTGANNASTLTDSAADFIDQGVEVGMTIFNETDGSKAEITAVTATTISGTLRGPLENDWDTNDVYRIVITNRWMSRAGQAAKVQVFKNERYLGMRGDR